MVNICPSPMAVYYCKLTLYMRPCFMGFLNTLVIAVVCPPGDSGHLQKQNKAARNCSLGREIKMFP